MFVTMFTFKAAGPITMSLDDLGTVPLDLNFTLTSTYSRALTPFHRAVS